MKDSLRYRPNLTPNEKFSSVRGGGNFTWKCVQKDTVLLDDVFIEWPGTWVCEPFCTQALGFIANDAPDGLSTSVRHKFRLPHISMLWLAF